MTTPIILFSDHPAYHSGLARITRDLATRIHEHMGDQFRIATLGYGSPGSSKLPFPQYNWRERDDFVPVELPRIWKDFCGDDPGIFMTIGDIQRFLPLADTKFCSDSPLAEWMSQMRKSGMLKLWGYFPIDAHGIGGKLGPQMGHTLSHYDRRLVPSEWAKEIVRETLPNHSCDSIPHGIDTSVFYPRDKEKSRDEFGEHLASVMAWPTGEMNVHDGALWIGIVATNQARKDWGLGIEIAAELRKTRPILLWCHVDAIKREWSILELLSDFGLLDCSIVTVGNLSDDAMARNYSACDVTLGIGRGEGFGYPIAESLACGVPCITSTYGAQSDYVHVADQIEPHRMHLEGPLNLLRPIHHFAAWENAIKQAVDDPQGAWLPDALKWENLWPCFDKWFRDGLSAPTAENEPIEMTPAKVRIGA